MKQSVRIVRNGFGANHNNNNNNNDDDVDDRDEYMNINEFAFSQSDSNSNVFSPKQGFNRISVASTSSGGSSSGYASSSSLGTTVKSPTAAKSPAWNKNRQSKLSASVEDDVDDDYVVPVDDQPSTSASIQAAIPAWKQKGKLPVVNRPNVRQETPADGNLSDYENLDELTDAPRSVSGALAKFGDRKPARQTSTVNNKKTVPVTPTIPAVAVKPPNSPPPGCDAVVPVWKRLQQQTGNGTPAAAASVPKSPSVPAPAAAPVAPWMGRQNRTDSHAITKSASEGNFVGNVGAKKKQPPPTPAKQQPVAGSGNAAIRTQQKSSGPTAVFPVAKKWGQMKISVPADSSSEDEKEYVDNIRPSPFKPGTGRSSSRSAPATSTYELFPDQDDGPPETDAPPPPRLWGPQVVKHNGNTYKNADVDTGRKFSSTPKPVPVPPKLTRESESNGQVSPTPVFSPPWVPKVQTPNPGRPSKNVEPSKPSKPSPGLAGAGVSNNVWIKNKTNDGGSSGAESNGSDGSMPPPLQPRVATPGWPRVRTTSTPTVTDTESRTPGSRRTGSDGSTAASSSSIADRPPAPLPQPENKSPKKISLQFRFPLVAIGKGRNVTDDNPASASVYDELPDDLSSNPWYFDQLTREESDSKLNRMLSQNGAFVVRERETTNDCPYAMDVVCKGHVYHLLIRQRADSLFAIGFEKPSEKKFTSLEELVSFYRNNDLEIARKDDVNLFVKLKKSPKKT